MNLTPTKDPNLWQVCLGIIGTTMEGEITWLERRIIYGACIIIMALAGAGYASMNSRMANFEAHQLDVMNRMTRVETLCGINIMSKAEGNAPTTAGGKK